MGRVATGVKGIALRRQDVVVAGVILKENDQTTEIMSISANGFGKRTRVDLYRLQSRGGKGIINFKVTSKTGPVVGAMPVRDNDGLIMLTSANKVVRIGVDVVLIDMPELAEPAVRGGGRRRRRKEAEAWQQEVQQYQQELQQNNIIVLPPEDPTP